MGQQQQATNNTPKPPPHNTKRSTIKKTANKTPLKNNITFQLPDPFLDGSKGKITNTKERTLASQRNNEGMPLPGIHATIPPLDNISVDYTCRSQTTGGTPGGNLSNCLGVTPLPPSNNDTTSTTEDATYTGLLPPTLPSTGEQVIGTQKKTYRAKMKAR